MEQTSEINNVLRVENFSKDYDNSVLKCMVNSINGKTRIVKSITLKHKLTALSPPLVLPRISRKKSDSPTRKESKGKKIDSMTKSDKTGTKTIFTCVAIEEEEEVSEPKYVWINGGLKKKTDQDIITATDDENKKFMCKTIPK